MSLATALQKGVEVAYKSVLKPVEGTILTVSRHFADAAVECAVYEKDIVTVMRCAMEAGQKALENTPNQLPVLKEAGVVDSGGQGFCISCRVAFWLWKARGWISYRNFLMLRNPR